MWMLQMMAMLERTGWIHGAMIIAYAIIDMAKDGQYVYIWVDKKGLGNTNIFSLKKRLIQILIQISDCCLRVQIGIFVTLVPEQYYHYNTPYCGFLLLFPGSGMQDFLTSVH